MFIANLLTVAEQVFILFLLILVGFICGKAKILGDGTVKQLSTFCLYFATPAVIVKSFIREFANKVDWFYILIFLPIV